MRPRLTRLIMFAAYGVAGLLLAGWLVVHAAVAVWGRGWLMSALQARGADVRIGRIEQVPSGIVLHEVRFNHPMPFSAESVRVEMHPWRFLTRPFDPDLLTVHVESPVVRVTGRGSIPPLKPIAVPFSIRFASMNVVLASFRQPLAIPALNGVIRVRATGYTADFDSSNPFWRDLHGRFSAGTLSSDPAWRLESTVRQVYAGPLQRSLEAATGEAFIPGRLQGALHIDLEAGGAWPPSGRDADWRLKVETPRLRWQRAVDGPALEGALSFSATPGAVSDIIWRGFDGASVRGDVMAPWGGKGVLNLGVNGKNTSIARLAEAAGAPSRLKMDGVATFDLLISGAVSAPRVVGRFDLLPRIQMLRLPRLKGSIDTAADLVSAGEVGEDGGLFRVMHSSMSDGWAVTVSSLSLTDWGWRNGWANVGGLLSAEGRLARGGGIRGRFDATGLSWGRMVASTAVAGEFAWGTEGLHMATHDDSILIDTFAESRWHAIRQARVRFGEASVVAWGAVEPGGRLDVEVRARNVPPDVWPPLVRRYPDMEAVMDVDGRIFGPGRALNGDISVAMRSVRLGQAGAVHDAAAHIRFSPSRIDVSSITSSSGLEGRVLVSGDGAEGAFYLRRFPAELVSEILKSREMASGSISGRFDFNSRVRTARLDANAESLSWARFFGEKVRLLGRLEGDRLVIEDGSVLSGSRRMRLSGAARRESGTWVYDADLQSQGWAFGSTVLDGVVKAAGRWNPADCNGRAVVRSDSLWVNARPVDGLRFTVIHSTQLLDLDGNLMRGVALSARVGIPSGRLSGHLEGRKIPLDDIVARLFPGSDSTDRPSGPMDVTVRLGGTLGKPLLDGAASAAGVLWRREEMALDVAFSADSSSITLKALRGRFESGGQFGGRGMIILGKGQPVDIDLSGQDLALNSLFNLLRWPVRWEGETDLAVLIQGGAEGRRILVKLDGSHEGYGPLRGEGALRGEMLCEKNIWDLSGLFIEFGGGFAKLNDGSQIFTERKGGGRLRLSLAARNLQAGPLNLFGSIELAGGWKRPRTEKDENLTIVDMDLFARSLWVNQYVLDGNITHMTLRPGRMDLSPIVGSGQQMSGTVLYPRYPRITVKSFRLTDSNGEKLYLDGEIGPDDWDYQARVRGVEASVVGGLLDFRMPMSGPISADLTGRGSAADPFLEGDVTWRDGRLAGVPIDQARAGFVLKDGILSLSDIRASRRNGFAVYGGFRYATKMAVAPELAPTEMNLVLTRGDLEVLEDIWPDCRRARGTFSGSLNLSAKSGRSQLSGRFHVQKASLRTTGYLPELSQGELDLQFEKNRMFVRAGRARIGDGRVSLDGTVDFSDGSPSRYDLRFKTEEKQGAEIQVPQLAIQAGPVLGRFSLFKKKLTNISRGAPRFSLTLKGKGDAPMVAGEVILEKTYFTFPPKAGAGGADREWLARRLDEFIDRLSWDVTLRTGEKTWYQNELVDAKLDGGLHVSGPTGSLAVEGALSTTHGAIVYAGNEFRINSADLTVSPAGGQLEERRKIETLVYLRAQAEREVFYTDGLGNSVRDVIIMTVDRSLLGDIQPRFRSKNTPSLSSERAFHLALGLPLTGAIESNPLVLDPGTANNREETDKLLRSGLVQLIDASLASPLARALARRTGLVDFIRVSYQEGDPLANTTYDPNEPTATNTTSITANPWLRYVKGTKVKMGRELTRRLFADYSFRVDEYQQQIDLRHEVALAYRLYNNLFVRATTELDTQRTLGRAPDRRALIENQWRFRFPWAARKTAEPAR